jgi:hypothetical protein
LGWVRVAPESGKGKRTQTNGDGMGRGSVAEKGDRVGELVGISNGGCAGVGGWVGGVVRFARVAGLMRAKTARDGLEGFGVRMRDVAGAAARGLGVQGEGRRGRVAMLRAESGARRKNRAGGWAVGWAERAGSSAQVASVRSPSPARADDAWECERRSWAAGSDNGLREGCAPATGPSHAAETDGSPSQRSNTATPRTPARGARNAPRSRSSSSDVSSMCRACRHNPSDDAHGISQPSPAHHRHRHRRHHHHGQHVDRRDVLVHMYLQTSTTRKRAVRLRACEKKERAETDGRSRNSIANFLCFALSRNEQRVSGS